MAYCVPLGIPHTVFLGRVWPDSSAPHVPYWTDHDRVTALSFRTYEAARCHQCGSHPADWPVDERDDPPWAPVETRCRGCQVLARARSELTGEDVDMDGLTVGLAGYDPDQEYADALDAEERAARAGGVEPEGVERRRPTDRGMLEG